MLQMSSPRVSVFDFPHISAIDLSMFASYSASKSDPLSNVGMVKVELESVLCRVLKFCSRIV